MVEAKDVKVPQVGKVVDKGIENVEQLDKVLDDADKLAGEKAALAKEKERLEKELEEREAEPVEEPPVVDDGGNEGRPPDVEWGHNPNPQAAQAFQDHFMRDGLGAVSGVTRFWAKDAVDKLVKEKIEPLINDVANLQNYNAWFEASEELSNHFTEEFLERNKGEVMNFMKKHGNKPPSEGDLYKHMALIEKKEREGGEKDAGNEAVTEKRRKQAHMEGEGDAAPKTGVDMEGKTSKEMEGMLPHADDTQPIMEGE